jgi:hypothetical protein
MLQKLLLMLPQMRKHPGAYSPWCSTAQSHELGFSDSLLCGCYQSFFGQDCSILWGPDYKVKPAQRWTISASLLLLSFVCRALVFVHG